MLARTTNSADLIEQVANQLAYRLGIALGDATVLLQRCWPKNVIVDVWTAQDVQARAAEEFDCDDLDEETAMRILVTVWGSGEWDGLNWDAIDDALYDLFCPTQDGPDLLNEVFA